MMANVARDAERLPWRPVSPDAGRPRRRDVWIRIDGEWRRGWVRAWERDGEQWRVWVHYEQKRRIWSTFAWFRWDPETIVERDGDEAPEG